MNEVLKLVEEWDLTHCSNKARIYFLLDYNDNIVYIGKSESSVFQRVKDHKKSGKWFSKVKIFEVDRRKLESIERALIIKHNPKYNKRFCAKT